MSSGATEIQLGDIHKKSLILVRGTHSLNRCTKWTHANMR